MHKAGADSSRWHFRETFFMLEFIAEHIKIKSSPVPTDVPTETRQGVVVSDFCRTRGHARQEWSMLFSLSFSLACSAYHLVAGIGAISNECLALWSDRATDNGPRMHTRWLCARGACASRNGSKSVTGTFHCRIIEISLYSLSHENSLNILKSEIEIIVRIKIENCEIDSLKLK